MRAKAEVFEEFFNQMNKKGNDFFIIKELLNSEDGKLFFLGVREDYLSIYYMGMSIATVKAIKTGGCRYTLSYYYLKGVQDLNGNKKYDDKTQGSYALSSEEFWMKDNFEQILKNVRNHVLGFGLRGCVYLEKACQQWIINSNNNDPTSNWYYVDMEYIYKEDGKKSNHPFGRADIIAISKRPNKSGIFDLAFVELKVGTGAYDASIKVPEKIGREEERDKYREDVKKCLKSSLWRSEVIGVKLGSGLASHIVDFMHFLADDKAIAQLRKEIFGIVDVHRRFDLIDNTIPLYNLESDNKIKMTPDIYIVTYSEAPGICKEMLSKNAQERYKISSLKKMKLDFCKYFYDVAGASSLTIERLIQNKDISGFIEKKKDYLLFMNTDEAQIECIQKINGREYRFVFRFIDLKDESINPINCID